MIDRFNVVWLALTYNCNNKCVWCYSSSDEEIPRESLEEKKIIPIVTFLKQLGIKRTILIGGEPSIYPHYLFIGRTKNKKSLREWLQMGENFQINPSHKKWLEED